MRENGPVIWVPAMTRHSLRAKGSCQLSVIPGVGITRCSHIERKDQITPDWRRFSVASNTVQYKTVQYSTVEYSTVQYSTVHKTRRYNTIVFNI